MASASDIFLSYEKSDRATAERLAVAFQRERWTVFWDHKTPPGKTWAEVIESSIRTSRCVVVLWSKTSIHSKWVHKEARFAEKRNCLIPVLAVPRCPNRGGSWGLIGGNRIHHWLSLAGRVGILDQNRRTTTSSRLERSLLVFR